jgi:hypothetical protein
MNKISLNFLILTLLVFIISCSDQVAGGNSGSEAPNAISLVLPDGTPAAHARVRFANSDSYPDANTDTSWLSADEYGQLNIESLPFPLTRLEARMDNLSLSFVLSQSTKGIDITDTLKPSASLNFEVMLPLQSFLPGFWIEFKGLSSRTYCELHSCELTISNLPAGDWEYRIVPQDSLLEIREQPVSLVEGERRLESPIEVPFALQISPLVKNDTLRIDVASLLSGYSDILYNYPLLVQLDRSFDWSGMSLDGSDIRFSDISGNALPFKREVFSAYSGIASFWVQIPALSADRVELQIILQRGIEPELVEETNPFDSFYTQAWHLDESLNQPRSSALASGNSCMADSAGNSDEGAGLSNAVGVSGYALRTIAGDGWLNCGEISVGDTMTLSAWVKSDSIVPWARIIYRRSAEFTEATHFEYSLNISDSNQFTSNYLVEAGNLTTYEATEVDLGEWYHLVTRFNGHELTFFVNGDSTTSMAGSPPHMPGTGPSTLAGDPYSLGTQRLFGALDEVRFSSNARSNAWIAADYRSQVPGNRIVNW